jgi:hypothetical protein
VAKIGDYDIKKVRATIKIGNGPTIPVEPWPAGLVLDVPSRGVVFKRGQVVVAEPSTREVRAGGHLYLGTGQWCRWCGRATDSPTSGRCRCCNAGLERALDAYVPWPLRPASPVDGWDFAASDADSAEARLYHRVLGAAEVFGDAETAAHARAVAEAVVAFRRDERVLRAHEDARHAAQCEVDRQRFTARRTFTSLSDGHLEPFAAAAASEALDRHDLRTEFGVRVRDGEVDLVFPGETDLPPPAG